MSFGRFIGMWVLMAIGMTLNGIGRELALKRLLPDRAADVVSAMLGILIIGLVTRWGFRPLTREPPVAANAWLQSVALILLTVGFETAVGRYVDHRSWPQIAEHYAIWRGELWPIVLAWLALTPFVWSRGWLRS